MFTIYLKTQHQKHKNQNQNQRQSQIAKNKGRLQKLARVPKRVQELRRRSGQTVSPATVVKQGSVCRRTGNTSQRASVCVGSYKGNKLQVKEIKVSDQYSGGADLWCRWCVLHLTFEKFLHFYLPVFAIQQH